METIKLRNPLDEYNLHLASQIVNRLPPDLHADMRALAIIEKGILTGVDAFGERISPEACDVLKRVRDEMMLDMTKKYLGNENEDDIDRFLTRKGFGKPFVNELLRLETT